MRMQVTALLLLVLWVAACVSAPPERTQYLLRYDTAPAVPAASPASGKLKVGLGSVSVAAYLTQPGLALETAPNQLRSAQNHLWAEPLAAGLTLYLRAAIAARLGEAVGLQTGSAPGSMEEEVIAPGATSQRFSSKDVQSSVPGRPVRGVKGRTSQAVSKRVNLDGLSRGAQSAPTISH